jgi:DNA invertase Pin-like site-specific DNA recombinase
MKVGYIRVSTPEQNTIRQEVLMEELGVDKVFIDRASGKNTARPELQKMLQYVREGDMVVVESYSRIARSTKDLLNIVENLRDKNVEFISKKESIDTTTPAGRLMLTVFAGLYQFERESLLERQAEGIREAKKEGKYRGRQPIKVDWKAFGKLYAEWKAGNRTAASIQRELKLKQKTFYRRVADYERNEKGSGNEQ